MVLGIGSLSIKGIGGLGMEIMVQKTWGCCCWCCCCHCSLDGLMWLWEMTLVIHVGNGFLAVYIAMM